MPSSQEVLFTYLARRMGDNGVNPETIPEFADLLHGLPRTSDLKHVSNVLYAFREWAVEQQNLEYSVNYDPESDNMTSEELREIFLELGRTEIIEAGVNWGRIYIWILITIDMVFHDIESGNKDRARQVLFLCIEILDRPEVQTYINSNGGWRQAPNPSGASRRSVDAESVALGTNLILGLSMMAAMTVQAINYLGS